VRSAAALARSLDARLSGLAAEVIPPMATSDPYGLLAGEFTAPLQAQIELNFREAQEAFRRLSEGLETDWTVAEDEPVKVMSRKARGADLIVAGGSPLSYRDTSRWCDPGLLALNSGRPVLVAPPSGGELGFDAAVVAWRDTREARRAVADSLPFLQCVGAVAVVEFCDRIAGLKEADARTHEVVEALQHHGVRAQAHAKLAASDAVAPELGLLAARLGGNLIVAGAYGHSRIGEWAFGGVTHDLLAHTDQFLLLSH
jgi:nucleotide-binding universal stress UspA family protein